MVGFAILTQLPPSAYNFHDDFQRYMTYPVRMLQTGTVYGSPLSSIGRTTLGGEAVLQGFILAQFPIKFVNGADAIFCLLLCLAMLCSFGTRYPRASFATLLALLLAAFINPQYVNVSPIYSASALIMALMLTQAEPDEDDAPGLKRYRTTIVTALIYAALVALKPTFVPFVVFHLLLSMIFERLARRTVRDILITGLLLVGATMAFVSPWILVHLPHYLQGFSAPPLFQGVAEGPLGNYLYASVNPFATATLFWGDSFLHYSIVVLGIGGVAAASALFSLRPAADPQRATLRSLAASGFAGFALYLFILTSFARSSFGDSDTALRYFCPIVIGVAPTAMLMAWKLWPVGSGVGRLRPAHLGLTSLALLSLLGFSRSFVARMAQAAEYGSIIAFRPLATSEPYLDYSRAALDSETLAKLRGIQSMVPAKEPLMVWNSIPFDLDFQRNPIFDVDISGPANPWATLPPVRYVLWEYHGYGTRTVGFCREETLSHNLHDRRDGELCLSFLKLLDDLAEHSQILYNDGETVLFHLAKPLENQEHIG
jgi:hypothetical protein